MHHLIAPPAHRQTGGTVATFYHDSLSKKQLTKRQ